MFTMVNMDELKAKQAELSNTEQELKNTKEELMNKRNELESARLENENKKTELINQLISEIEALQRNAQDYEKQIESISQELSTLREHSNSTNHHNESTIDDGTATEQTTVDQTTTQQTTVDQTTTQQTTVDQTTTQQATVDQTTTQQTTVDQTTTQQATVDQTTAQQATVDQTTTQQTTIDQTTSQQTVDEQTTSQQTVDEQPDIKLDSYEWYNKALSQLIFEIDWCTATAKYKRWLNKSWKETLKTAKAKLKQYKDIISGKKEHLEHEFKQKNKLNAKNPDKVPLTVSISASEINWLKKRRGDRRKVIEEDIKAGQRGESSNIAPRPNQSLEQVIKWNKIDTHHNEYDSKLNEALNDAAFLRIIDNNQDRARAFLQAIANNSLSNQQITFCKTHMVQLSPYFTQYGMMPQVYRCIQTNGWRIDTTPWTSKSSVDYRNLERWDAFSQWWIAWVIDKALSSCNNLTPWQRNTWKNIGVLWCYAAWIYWLYKFFTNKKMSFWGKALTTGWVIFWSQLLTWESPISLFNKLMNWWLSRDELNSKFWNAFWDAVDGVHNSWIEGANNISWAMYSLMVFNKDTKVWDVRALSTRFKNNPQEWEIFRWKAETNLGRKNFERFSAVFSKNFDEDKRNNWLTSIGIHDGIDDNKLVYELAGNKTMNAVVVNKFLSDNWVKVTDNKAKKEEFEQYIKSINDNNQAINIDVLQNHKNDRFTLDTEATFTDRPEDTQNKEKLWNQVDQLSLDEQTKSDLKNEIQLFYDERPIKNKPNLNDFSLQMDNNLLILKSHNWEKTKINLQNKTLTWFWSTNSNNYEIKFTRTKELLDAAYLTNDVLARQKNKPIVNTPPFQYKPERKWICFNDAETISFNFDTRVLSTWRWWATSKIETLYNNPKEYADYLSKCRLEQNTTNIDSTLYPIVKKLSEAWINFTNEQEVKDLENRLKWIKEKLKIFKCHADWNPFSIGTISKKLEFKSINGDTEEFPENISEKFPTLTREWNKEKFLNILNDPNNKMRWSALSN